MTWGKSGLGGDGSAARGAAEECAARPSVGAGIAAVLNNASVLTWGVPRRSGDSSAVQGRLRNMQHIQASRFALAAQASGLWICCDLMPSWGRLN